MKFAKEALAAFLRRIRAELLPLSALAVLAVPVATAQPVPSATSALKRLSIDELMDIAVTSVSRLPERRFDAASAIQVIGADDIHRSGATRLPEALRLAPNLHVAQIDTGLWAISARGFNNGLANKLLVLMDGRTIYSPLFAGVFWDVQDAFMEDVDRIEVVSGPGGTLWGSNAVNGVISVITKKAIDTPGLLLEAGLGQELHDFGGIRYGGAVGSNLHYRVYGKYTARDSSRLPGGTQWTDNSRSGRGGLRADWQAYGGGQFTVQGDFYESESGALLTRNHINADGSNLIGRWEQPISQDSDFKLQLYYDRARRRSEGQFTDVLETYDLDFQHRFGWGQRHDVIWGFGYRQIEDLFLSIAGQTFLPPRLSHRLFSAFVQDAIAFRDDRVHLTVGAKLEHNDYTQLEAQPSIRLAVKPDDRQTLWGAISRAVRAPSRFDRDLHIPNRPPFAVVGGPDFVSEVLIAYEVGYRLQPDARVSFELATFYSDYDDIRSVELANPPALLPLEIRNGLAGRSYGAELSTDYLLTQRWRLSAGYRYLDVQLRVDPGSTDITSVNSEAHDPDHLFLLRSLLDLPNEFQLDATFRYADRISTHRVPAHEVLDLRVAWRPLPPLELSIVGTNLLHAHHAEFRPLATRHAIERSVFGKILWSF
jgi:iron complex outermembrane recepter protein